LIQQWLDATPPPNGGYIQNKTYPIAMYSLYRGWAESYDSSNNTYSTRLGATTSEFCEVIDTAGYSHAATLYLLGFK
jgi:hypothetical protein